MLPDLLDIDCSLHVDFMNSMWPQTYVSVIISLIIQNNFLDFVTK